LEKFGNGISHNISSKKGKHRPEDESNDVEEKFWGEDSYM